MGQVAFQTQFRQLEAGQDPGGSTKREKTTGGLFVIAIAIGIAIAIDVPRSNPAIR